jgi:hypothetical protein
MAGLIRASLMVFASTGCFVLGPFDTKAEARQYGEDHLNPDVVDDDVSWAAVNYIDVTAIDAGAVEDILTSDNIAGESEGTTDQDNTAQPQSGAGSTTLG